MRTPWLHRDESDFEIQTAQKTIVEVELNMDGTIDEASGDASLGGDVFVPGDGRISLAEAIDTLKNANKRPSGDWSFEKKRVDG